MKKHILALSLTVFFAPAARADRGALAIEKRWRAFEKLCDATFVIRDLPQMVQSGISFQLDAKTTKKDLKRFTTVTCPKNWDKLNGQKSAQEIIPEFQRLAEASVQLKDRADKQGAEVAKILDSIARDLRVLRVDFGKLSCGKALGSMVTTYRREKEALERRVSEIKTACPALAKVEAVEQATAGAAHTYGKSAPDRVPASGVKTGTSDLTGTGKAIRDQEASKSLIEKK